MNPTACHKCQYFHGEHKIVCALHPTGPIDQPCTDFQLASTSTRISMTDIRRLPTKIYNEARDFADYLRITSSSRFEGILYASVLVGGSLGIGLTGFVIPAVLLMQDQQPNTLTAKVVEYAVDIFVTVVGVGTGILMLRIFVGAVLVYCFLIGLL